MADQSSQFSPTSLTPEAREQLREQSKGLFGNKDRLDVLLAIADSDDGMVNATDLEHEIGLINSRVRAQLRALVKVGLLSEVDTGQDKKRWYIRSDSSFWQACQDLYTDWTRSEAE